MKPRVRASLIHLLISVCLVSSVFAFVLLVCYPDPYYKVIGVGKLLVVLAFVDVCLGPLITLVIFNPKKRFLKWELAFIGMLQLSALAYGANTMFIGRPVFIVYHEYGFSLVSAYQIPEVELKKMNYPSLSITGPKLVGAKVPETREGRKLYIQEVLEAHADLPRMLQYHVPYESMKDDIKEKMLSIDKLFDRQYPEKLAAAKAALDDALRKNHVTKDEVGFIPMNERDSDLTVLLRRKDAGLLTILPIDPYGKVLHIR